MEMAKKILKVLIWALFISFILMCASYLSLRSLDEGIRSIIQVTSSGVFSGAILAVITTVIEYHKYKNDFINKLYSLARAYYNSITRLEKFIDNYSENVQNTVVNVNNSLSASITVLLDNLPNDFEFTPIFGKAKKNRQINQFVFEIERLILNLNSYKEQFTNEITTNSNKCHSALFNLLNVISNDEKHFENQILVLDKVLGKDNRWLKIKNSVDESKKISEDRNLYQKLYNDANNSENMNKLQEIINMLIMNGILNPDLTLNKNINKNNNADKDNKKESNKEDEEKNKKDDTIENN